MVKKFERVYRNNSFRTELNEHKQKNYIQNFESLKDGLHFNSEAVATVVMDAKLSVIDDLITF
jgi:hypothetical protein